MLAGWTAMWHPRLLAAAKQLPTWYRADSPPDGVGGKLVIVPGVSRAEMPTGFAQRAEDEGAVLIQEKLDRVKIIERALASLDAPAEPIDNDTVADFLALGYCYLQVQLLTRQMRYSSNLDEMHFENQLIAAAEAAVGGDKDETYSRLTSCFDVLAEERDHYYPVEAFLLDLTMVAPTTLGASLKKQLDESTPSNLVLSGELLGEIRTREPDTLSSLRQALDAGTVGLIGGEQIEGRLPLMSYESILAQLQEGQAQFESVLGRRATVFGRRRFGLTPGLPQVLDRCGFTSAMHITLDEGSSPEGSQIKVRWEGCEGTAIEAVARPPFNAGRPDTFLGFAVKLGESMDMDHVATACFAHWPGHASPWYEDLRRVARFGSALGKFITIEDYFRDTDLPVHQDRFTADQYRSPYLSQAVRQGEANPISSVADYWRRRTRLDSARSLDALATLVSGKTAVPSEDTTDAAEGTAATLPGERALASIVDAAGEVAAPDSLDGELDAKLNAAQGRMAGSLPRAGGEAETGYLVLNPRSFVRRVGIDVPSLASLPPVDRPIYAAAGARESQQVVVDVPPMGFVWVSPSTSQGRGKTTSQALADECLLRNEFLEALIDPDTGALRAVHEYNSRGNRFSQQLAMRFGPGRKRAGQSAAGQALLYSVMKAESVRTTIATPVLGEVVSEGKLLDHKGDVVAGFQQTFRLWRGARVLHVEITLDPQKPCTDDAWNSYYGVRSAWPNEAAELARSVNQSRHVTSAKRFESPHYVEIDDGSCKIALLTGGAAFHRKIGYRMLDTLLVVKGEQCRTFRMGIGVGLKNPIQDALNLFSPPIVIEQQAPATLPATSGWLFHVDARSVLATDWEPLQRDGGVRGFRVRLLETAGRSVKARLSSFRPATAARRTDFTGSVVGECEIEDGKIGFELKPRQWTQIEADW